MRNERGAGSIIAVALIGAIVALTGLTLPLYSALVTRAAVAGAADAAALAAADVAVGIAPGFPCAAAAQVAAANGVIMHSCVVDGVVVTVSVRRWLLGIAVTGTATAGPPLGESD